MSSTFFSRRVCQVLAALLLVGCLIALLAGISHAQRRPRQPSDFVLLLDSSTSIITNDPQELRLKAARLFFELMVPGDRAAIVAFGTGARRLQGLTGGKAELTGALQKAANHTIRPNTATDLDRGLQEAYNVLVDRGVTGRPGIIILLSDGQPDPSWSIAIPGTPEREKHRQMAIEAARREVERFVEKGWLIYTIALCVEAPGWPCSEPLMREIATETGADSRKASSAGELPGIYVNTLAGIYGYRRSDVANRPAPFDFRVGPDAQELIGVGEGGQFDLQPLTPTPVETSQSQVENFYLARIAEPPLGQWHVAATQPVTITYLLLDLSYGVRLTITGPQPVSYDERGLRVYDVGTRLDFQATLVWVDSGTPVLEENYLGFVEEITLQISRDGLLLPDAPVLKRSPGEVYYAGSYTLETPGHYKFEPVLLGFIKQGEAVSVLAASSPSTVTPPPPTVTPRSPLTIRLDQPQSPYRLPRATAPRYGLLIQGQVLARPVPTPIFVVGSDTSGRERFRTPLTVKESGEFNASSPPDMCERLTAEEETVAQAWRFDDDRLWLQETYDLSFYVGNVSREPPPQALAIFSGRRVEITPTLRLRIPPDGWKGWPPSLSPGDQLGIQAYINCNRQHVPLQDSPVADRVRGVALLRKVSSDRVQEVALSASVGRQQDFIGQVVAPIEPGTYTIRVEVRPKDNQVTLAVADPITFTVVSR